jgi:hypothetical protein
MRKWVATLAGLACLVGVIGGTVVANARTSITSPESFTVIGTQTKGKGVDVGKKGPSPGDSFFFVEQLTDEEGADVGKARIECTQHVGPWAICTGTFDITDRGEIVGAGMVPFGPNVDMPLFDVPVTGGTGDFANVRGEVHVEPTETGERDTFDLIP